MSIDDAYRSLGYKVVLVAVQEYKSALKGNCESKMRDLERFFRSDEFKIYCELDGEAVIKELRKGR